MKEIAVREARNRLGHLLDAARRAPVRLTKKSRPVGVVMSVQQYERLRGAAWERLTDTLDRPGAEAAARGLTDARLDALLADDRGAYRYRLNKRQRVAAERTLPETSTG